MPPRRYVLHEANYGQLHGHRPDVAVLPWGATEAHNYHMPHGSDIIEATALAEGAAQIADEQDARVIVLPPVPFGSNAQQLDQVATIHLSTPTMAAILSDVTRSLMQQGIDRLVIVNSHGGNELKGLVRDVQADTGMLIVVINFWQLIPDQRQAIFDEVGDHADETETSLMLHLHPDWVALEQAGEGASVPFDINALQQPGIWTPRPWSSTQPDTGSGDPRKATAEKGRQYFEQLTGAIAEVLIALCRAEKGQTPYL